MTAPAPPQETTQWTLLIRFLAYSKHQEEHVTIAKCTQSFPEWSLVHAHPHERLQHSRRDARFDAAGKIHVGFFGASLLDELGATGLSRAEPAGPRGAKERSCPFSESSFQAATRGLRPSGFDPLRLVLAIAVEVWSDSYFVSSLEDRIDIAPFIQNTDDFNRSFVAR